MKNIKNIALLFLVCVLFITGLFAAEYNFEFKETHSDWERQLRLACWMNNDGILSNDYIAEKLFKYTYNSLTPAQKDSAADFRGFWWWGIYKGVYRNERFYDFYELDTLAGMPIDINTIRNEIENNNSFKYFEIVDLGRYREYKTKNLLYNLISDNDSDIRWASAWSLCMLGDDAFVDTVINALALENVLYTFYMAFQRLPNPPINKLIECLAVSEITEQSRFYSDEWFWSNNPVTVRTHAMIALASIGERAIPALHVALNDDRALVRENAAEALGRIADTTSIKQLKKLAKTDPELPVREASKWALTAIYNQHRPREEYLAEKYPCPVQPSEHFGHWVDSLEIVQIITNPNIIYPIKPIIDTVEILMPYVEKFDLKMTTIYANALRLINVFNTGELSIKDLPYLASKIENALKSYPTTRAEIWSTFDNVHIFQNNWAYGWPPEVANFFSNIVNKIFYDLIEGIVRNSIFEELIIDGCRDNSLAAINLAGRFKLLSASPILESNISKDKCRTISEQAITCNVLGEIGCKTSVPILKSLLESNIESGWVWRQARIALSTINTQFVYTMPEFEKMADFSEGLVGIKINDKWGYLNYEGVLVIKPQFDIVERFRNGYAKVNIGGKDGYFEYRQGGKWGLISSKGDVIFEPQFDEILDFCNGIARVINNEKWGYIRDNGEVICKPQFVWCSEYSEDNIARVRINNKEGYINAGGEIVCEPQFDECNDFSEGLASIKIDDIYGFIDRQFKIVIKPNFKYARDFSEGLACVLEYPIISIRSNQFIISERYGYIDTYGNYAIEPEYTEASSFSEGLAAVGIDEKYGYINKQGKIIIEMEYDYVAEFKEGKAYVNKGSESFYINKEGKRIKVH